MKFDREGTIIDILDWAGDTYSRPVLEKLDNEALDRIWRRVVPITEQYSPRNR